jgi:oxygen-independent coproporphyrinogen-3 oxidase
LSDAATGRVVRTARVRQPGLFLAAAQPAARLAEVREVPQADLAFEFCLNALRLCDGFDAALFEARTGRPWSDLAVTVAAAAARGLLVADAGGRWVPTERGQRFLNDLQAMFLPEAGDRTPGAQATGLAPGPGIG